MTRTLGGVLLFHVRPLRAYAGHRGPPPARGGWRRAFVHARLICLSAPGLFPSVQRPLQLALIVAVPTAGSAGSVPLGNLTRRQPYLTLMTKYGFHVSHEQFDPAELLAARAIRLRLVVAGRSFGADDLSISLRICTGLPVSPGHTGPSGATLSFMYPDRLWMALGSGERVNEGITGLPWPIKSERNERLHECAGIEVARFV